MKNSTEERLRYFEEHVSMITDECIRWAFAHSSNGYGALGNRQVHVMACERANGPKPGPGYEVAHQCTQFGSPVNNKDCFNPKHLEWKTRAGNVADQYRDGEAVVGERHYMAKLTARQVWDLQQDFWSDGRSRGMGAELARRYGVTKDTIYDVIKGVTWKHIDPDDVPPVMRRVRSFPD